MSAPGIWLGTFLFALAAGLLPILNTEAYLLAISVAFPHAQAVPVALAAALGQMTAKSVLYLAGTGVLNVSCWRMKDRMRAVVARLGRVEGRPMAVVLASAVTGIPPFYAVGLAAGMLRLPFGRYLVVGASGAFLRFAAVLLLPRLW